MIDVKFLILGAGPTGLSIAHSLLRNGERADDILVIEQERTPGGLCRSAIVDNAPIDIGGGHFLDTRREAVLEFLFEFLPRTDWTLFDRIAKIHLCGRQIDHPLEGNLWQLSTDDQLDFLESIARAGSQATDAPPASFEDWIEWKLGRKIAQEYMLPYNRKLWSTDLNKLGTYWLEKLPNVSFRETLLSCLERKTQGALPAHGRFFYPTRHGYGEVWKRMGKALGERLLLSTPVESIDIEHLTVNAAFRARTIISSIPWTNWPSIAEVPADIANEINSLMHIPITIEHHSADYDTDAHWVYDPRDSVSHHRVLVRRNFCFNASGYWTETNSRRISQVPGGFHHRNEFAYPVATRGKPAAIDKIKAWARQKGIIAAGRWGTWEHINSDVAVTDGIALGRALSQQRRT